MNGTPILEFFGTDGGLEMRPATQTESEDEVRMDSSVWYSGQQPRQLAFRKSQAKLLMTVIVPLSQHLVFCYWKLSPICLWLCILNILLSIGDFYSCSRIFLLNVSFVAAILSLLLPTT
jgi:hypothetical protein